MANVKVPQARQLPSGTWFCQLRLDGKSVSISGATEKEVVARAMAIKAGLIKEKKKAQSVTLTAAIDRYIEARSAALSPSTVRGYRIVQKNRFQALMAKDLTRITQEQWQRAVNQEARICSAKTLKNAWGFISSVIHEETGERPTVRLPQVETNERPYLTPEQIAVFLQAVHGDEVEIPALLALSSLRRSELLHLSWDMVDLGRGVLRVSGAAVPDEDNHLIHRGLNKTRQSERFVPIIPQLRQALETAPRTGPYVVTKHPSSIFNRINKICLENGLPAVGIHGLRHSFASLAYHLQIPEKIAMEIGGWADDGTMRKIYTHIAQRDIADRAESFVDFYKSLSANENANGYQKSV